MTKDFFVLDKGRDITILSIQGECQVFMHSDPMHFLQRYYVNINMYILNILSKNDIS